MSAAKKKRAASDGGLVKAILAYCATQQNIHAERRNSGAMKVGDRFISLGKAGTLDISGYIGMQTQFGIPFEIECKSKTGALRPSQITRIALLKELGVPCCVAKGVSDVVKFFSAIRKGEWAI